MYSINKFSKLVNVTPQTLRNWHKSKKLVPFRCSSNGYRYYSEEQLQQFITTDVKPKLVIGYCRVSSMKQKDDLERQIDNVKLYMLSKGYQFQIITDIGSGINYHKKGLSDLINKIINKEISKIVVLYKDRLLRFGFELIENISKLHNVEIEIIDNTDTTEEQELVEDLIQIITVFSCRLQGKRAKKTKEILKELINANNT